MFHHSLLVYRKLFAFSTIWTRYKARQEADAPGSLPGSQLLPGALHSEHTNSSSSACCPSCWGTALCPPSPPDPAEFRAVEECPAPFNSREAQLCRSLQYLRISTASQTVVQSFYTTTWSTIQYSQVTIHITPQHQESILSDTKCYSTHAAEYSKTSSTKESIWLLRTNKLAGLFQVSFGSMLKYHDLTSSRVQKRSLTLSLDYSSLWETRKKNHVS